MSRSHHDQRTMCSGSQKICTESGKSVLAEQVSNTPNRSNHCATGKSTRENKGVGGGEFSKDKMACEVSICC